MRTGSLGIQDHISGWCAVGIVTRVPGGRKPRKVLQGWAAILPHCNCKRVKTKYVSRPNMIINVYQIKQPYVTQHLHDGVRFSSLMLRIRDTDKQGSILNQSNIA